MGIGIILKGLKNKFNELMGRDKKKDDTKKSSESLASKEEKRFDDTSPTKSKKTTASTDLDNTKNGASSGSVNSGEVHVEGLGQTTPAENTAPSAKQPSAGSRHPMPLPPSNVATNQTQRPGRLSPHSLPQNFSDPECQKQVIEKLKGNLSELIEKAKNVGLLDDSYNYNENIKCYDFDYPACNFLENVRVFWLKIAEIIYSKIEGIPQYDISYYIIKFQNEIGNSLQKTTFQSLLSTDNFVKTSNEFLTAIDEKIDKVGSKDVLEYKKSALIKSKGGTLNKLLSKFNELYEDDEYKHEQFEYKPKQFKEKESLDELQRSIEVFWQALKAKFGQGEKYKERAEKLDAKMKKFDSTIEDNIKMSTLEAINNVGEALDQKFNIIGRVVLYLEKRKNKEKGFFGKLFGKSKKSDKEDKKQKKEKLNNQKRLKKCFEDMGKYFVKNKDAVSATGLRKLVKNNDIDTYSEWNNGLCILLARNSISFNKELLMSALFISFIDLGDKESVIAACDGLKSGGIKSIDPKSFEGKATSIRKEIKGKCATLDMAKDKDDLKNYIKTLCKKYFGLDMSTLSLIGNIFGN